MKVISPIGIDLGAKHTGVFSTHYVQGEDPGYSPHSTGVILTIDDNNLQLSQVNRTQTRHQGRNYSRRKQVKRLFLTLVRERYGIDPYDWPTKDREFLFGLFNRRGFNRFDDESLDEIDYCNLAVFGTVIPEIDGYSDLDEWLQTLAENAADIQFALERLGTTKEFCANLPAEWQEEKKAVNDTHKYILKFLSASLNATEEGHLHRRDYLKNIAADIQQEQQGRLALLFQQLGKDNVSVDQVANLIGHLSNLQLRVLRRYFNDQSFGKTAGGDRWDSERFSEQFWRWIKSWHCNEQTKRQWHDLLKLRKKQCDIIDLLMSISPELTIPPYEDQNNRRPPKDKTLYLDPIALDRVYPLWREIVKRLVAAHPELDKKRAVYIASLDKKLDPDCLLLMRILDRSRDLDPYQTRKLADKQESNALTTCHNALTRRLAQHTDPFLKIIARPYYQQINEAKRGLWAADEQTLLLCLNRTPQRKAKLLPILLGGIVGNLGADGFQWIDGLKAQWGQRGLIKGTRSPKGWCKEAAELQKAHGGALKETLVAYRNLQGRIKTGQTEEKLPKEGKSLLALDAAALTVAQWIAQNLGLPPENSSRFANIFSLAQIYNLLEADPSGFSHTSRPTAEENLWRMARETYEDDKECARACVLSADSIRPFDGMLSRILEKQAYAIASNKLQQLENNVPQGCELIIPILLEENRFQFAEDLYTIKKNTKKKKLAQEGGERATEQFKDKNTRIRSAAQGVCAYTGNAISCYGEYDHIVPRSYTQKYKQGVFNHEANLIFVSATGNQQKGDQIYTLANLAASYRKKLQALFAATNITELEKQIRACVQPYIDKGDLIVYHTLSQKDQQAIRHALFIPELCGSVLELLAGQRKARVNGTQAWLAKRIIHHIRKSYSGKVHFEIIKVPTESVQLSRTILATQFPELAKQSPQPIASHVIDAALTVGSVIFEPKLAETLYLAPVDSGTQAEWLKSLLPATMTIQQLRRKSLYRKSDPASSPLFKAGLYAERFLPLLVNPGELRIGFTTQNSVQVTAGADHLYSLLHHCLTCTDKQQLPDTLEALQAGLGDDERVVLVINRPNAFAYLHRVGALPEYDEQCRALEGLLYSTQKKEINAHIYDDKSKAFKTRDDILKDKFFTVKPSFPRHIARVASSKLSLPCKKAWETICDDIEIARLLGTKQNLGGNFWRRLGRRIFPSHHTEQRSHQKTRKIYSLPVKAAGSSYRGRRLTPDGNPVWQRFTVDDFGAAGFAVENGTTLWNKVVELPHFTKSQDLVSIDRSLAEVPDAITFFDEWRTLDTAGAELPDGVLNVTCCPGSKDRIKVRLTLTEEYFLAWYNSTYQTSYETSWQVPLSIPHKDLISWDIFMHEFVPIPRKDKGNAIMCRLGSTVVFEYTANDGMKPALQQAWQQGVPESCI